MQAKPQDLVLPETLRQKAKVMTEIQIGANQNPKILIGKDQNLEILIKTEVNLN